MLFSFLMLLTWFSVSDEGWSLFATVKFKSTFIKEYNERFLVPVFDTKIRSMEGELITIKGHYMPFDFKDHTIILSRFPYASCFFCGGAGPESVAEIQLTSKPDKLKADQMLTVQGRLRLNDNDVNHMNFILTHAEIIKSEK
jgi:hypothetical protein